MAKNIFLLLILVFNLLLSGCSILDTSIQNNDLNSENKEQDTEKLLIEVKMKNISNFSKDFFPTIIGNFELVSISYNYGKYNYTIVDYGDGSKSVTTNFNQESYKQKMEFSNVDYNNFNLSNYTYNSNVNYISTKYFNKNTDDYFLVRYYVSQDKFSLFYSSFNEEINFNGFEKLKLNNNFFLSYNYDSFDNFKLFWIPKSDFNLIEFYILPNSNFSAFENEISFFTDKFPIAEKSLNHFDEFYLNNISNTKIISTYVKSENLLNEYLGSNEPYFTILNFYNITNYNNSDMDLLISEKIISYLETNVEIGVGGPIEERFTNEGDKYYFNLESNEFIVSKNKQLFQFTPSYYKERVYDLPKFNYSDIHFQLFLNEYIKSKK